MVPSACGTSSVRLAPASLPYMSLEPPRLTVIPVPFTWPARFPLSVLTCSAGAVPLTLACW